MKTPRDLFLDKHARMAPRLDAVRHQAIASLQNHPQEGRSFLATLWLELVVPCRRAWLGMGAGWVAAAVFALASMDFQTPVAARVDPASQELRLAIREQRELRDELLGMDTVEPVLPDRYVTFPRSDRRTEVMMG